MNAIRSAFSALFSSQSRISYRRLLIWLGATLLLVLGRLDQEWWFWLSAAYIGGDTLSRMSFLQGAAGASIKRLVARPDNALEIDQPDEPESEPKP